MGEGNNKSIISALYSNKVTVTAAAHEVMLKFELETPLENNEVKSDMVADIRMNPNIAVALRDILTEVIEAQLKPEKE